MPIWGITMFHSDKNKRHTVHTKDLGVTILSKGCAFTGKLLCQGSSRIAGRVEGEIISEGFLIVEEGANILAEISGENIIVHGKVEGTISAKRRLELSEKCEVNAEIITSSLFIKEGAKFNGSVVMTGQINEKSGDSKRSITDGKENSKSGEMYVVTKGDESNAKDDSKIAIN